MKAGDDTVVRLDRRGYLAIFLGWILYGLFNASRLRVVVPEITWERALEYGFPDGLIWALLTPIPVFFAARFPLPAQRPLRNAGVHLAAGSLVAIAHSALDAGQNALRQYLTGGETLFVVVSRKLVLHTFHMNLLVYLVIAGMAMYLGRLQREREEERQAARLTGQLAEARLAALRTQLRPHFLFNALHTVGAVIERDPVLGRRLLRRLGELLRASLSTDEKREIPLSRELELTRAYLEIEQARFGDRLTVDFEIEDGLKEARIPPLLLQPLAENAIRHGIGAIDGPGRVRISAQRRDGHLELRVEDNGPGSREPWQEGIGLASVRERLRAHYGENHHFEVREPPGCEVTIEMPWRPSTTVRAQVAERATDQRRAS